MSTVVKHIWKYGEERRTVYLMAANKDEFGRHRGQVLYGMKLVPDGTQLTIGPGALYTPFGTRLYLDLLGSDAITIDLNTVGDNVDPGVDGVHSVLDTLNSYARPYAVAIVAKFDALDPTSSNLPVGVEIDTKTELLANVSFKARVVSYSRETLQPSYNIVAQTPIFLNEGPQPDGDYGTKKTWNNADQTVRNTDFAVNFDEILLGVLYVGGVTGSETLPTELGAAGIWADGITCIQSRNAWEAIEDFLGADVLIGRNAVSVTNHTDDLDANRRATALNQLAGLWQATGVGGATCTYLVTPKFGSSEDDTWATYQLPSFFKDGESLVSNLRRLDYYMRLWLDRTGDKTLVSGIQDGGIGGVPLSLEELKASYDGSDNVYTNNSVMKYGDSYAVTYTADSTANEILKSGLAPHADLALNDILGTAYGDSHYSALYATSIAVKHVLADVLGVSIGRGHLRSQASWGTPQFFIDQPKNGATPAYTGAAFSSPYTAAGSTFVAVINSLLSKSNAASGQNWLRNGTFWSPDEDDDAAPSSWILGGGCTATASTSSDFRGMTFSIPAGSKVSQTVSDYPGITAPFLLSAALFLKTASNDLVLRITGVSDAGTSTAQVPISAATLAQTVTLSTWVTATIEDFTFSIENVGSTTQTCVAYNAALNSGPPITVSLSSMAYDFLSRDGASMRGNIDMVGKAIHNLSVTAVSPATNLLDITLAGGVASATIAGDHVTSYPAGTIVKTAGLTDPVLNGDFAVLNSYFDAGDIRTVIVFDIDSGASLHESGHGTIAVIDSQDAANIDVVQKAAKAVKVLIDEEATTRADADSVLLDLDTTRSLTTPGTPLNVGGKQITNGAAATSPSDFVIFSQLTNNRPDMYAYTTAVQTHETSELTKDEWLNMVLGSGTWLVEYYLLVSSGIATDFSAQVNVTKASDHTVPIWPTDGGVLDDGTLDLVPIVSWITKWGVDKEVQVNTPVKWNFGTRLLRAIRGTAVLPLGELCNVDLLWAQRVNVSGSGIRHAKVFPGSWMRATLLDYATYPPTISSFSPTSGTPSTTVTINGANFAQGVSVTFDGVSATSIVVVSPARITCKPPVHVPPTTTPNSVALRVTNPNGLYAVSEGQAPQSTSGFKYT